MFLNKNTESVQKDRVDLGERGRGEVRGGVMRRDDGEGKWGGVMRRGGEMGRGDEEGRWGTIAVIPSSVALRTSS